MTDTLGNCIVLALKSQPGIYFSTGEIQRRVKLMLEAETTLGIIELLLLDLMKRHPINHKPTHGPDHWSWTE